MEDVDNAHLSLEKQMEEHAQKSLAQTIMKLPWLMEHVRDAQNILINLIKEHVELMLVITIRFLELMEDVEFVLHSLIEKMQEAVDMTFVKTIKFC